MCRQDGSEAVLLWRQSGDEFSTPTRDGSRTSVLRTGVRHCKSEMWILVVVVGGMFSSFDTQIVPMSEQQCKAMVINTGEGSRVGSFCVKPDGSRWPENGPKYADWRIPERR